MATIGPACPAMERTHVPWGPSPEMSQIPVEVRQGNRVGCESVSMALDLIARELFGMHASH
eukprot:scaffold69465_cov38-Tisochrysis_lutea.AAC.3